MDLNLTDDQELLRETTHKFLTANWPTSAVRELIDDPIGFDRDIWAQGADLGWTSCWCRRCSEAAMSRATESAILESSPKNSVDFFLPARNPDEYRGLRVGSERFRRTEGTTPAGHLGR